MSNIIITPLGTVSPYPKNDMNCPGFLIEYNSKKLLLDCGNGCARLLTFPNDLKDLDVVITHLHKDHFGDLGALQYAAYVYHNLGLISDKIDIYLPYEEFGFNKKSITSNDESFANYHDISDDYSFLIDDLRVSFEDNKSHTIESYMVKLQNKDFKIIYSSDIGITNFDRLVEFCKDADLIICESSFLKVHNSNSKTHMRAIDAGRLAKEANVKKLLLTHFWPEEDKSLYLKEAQEIFENTDIAEEGKKLVLRRQNGRKIN